MERVVCGSVYSVYCVHGVYCICNVCMLYIDPSPLWYGGVDRRAYPIPPHTIGGGAAITDHEIIYLYIYIIYCIFSNLSIFSIRLILFVLSVFSVFSNLSILSALSVLSILLSYYCAIGPILSCLYELQWHPNWPQHPKRWWKERVHVGFGLSSYHFVFWSNPGSQIKPLSCWRLRHYVRCRSYSV